MNNYSLLVNESRIRAISNNTTTGRATKNNDSGSGGDRNAPKMKEVNQMCFLYPFIWARLKIPSLRINKVATGD